MVWILYLFVNIWFSSYVIFESRSTEISHNEWLVFILSFMSSNICFMKLEALAFGAYLFIILFCLIVLLTNMQWPSLTLLSILAWHQSPLKIKLLFLLAFGVLVYVFYPLIILWILLNCYEYWFELDAFLVCNRLLFSVFWSNLPIFGF